MALFQHLGRLDLNKKAVGRCGFTVFCDFSTFATLVDTSELLLLMQISGLTDQCNRSFFYYLCFYGSPLPIAHQGREVWWSKLFPRQKKSGGGEYIINNLNLSKWSCCSVQDRLAVPIRRKNIVLVWKSGVKSRVAVSSVSKGQLTSLVQKEQWIYWQKDRFKNKFKKWSVKPMVCMNVSPEILLIY